MSHAGRCRKTDPAAGPRSATADLIAERVRRIVDHLHPERVILFGSRVSDVTHPDSDVDFLVVVSGSAETRCHEVTLHRWLAGIVLPEDIVVVTSEDFDRYRHVQGTIAHSALVEGKVLYERAR